MSLFLKIFLTIFVIILLSFVGQLRRRKKQPPGPLGFPFFGEKPYQMMKLFFPQLFSKDTDSQRFMKMKKKYGDIWSMDLGDKKIVVLSSYDQLTKVFVDNGKLFSGKHINKYYKIIGERRGIAFFDGEECMANRQMAIKSLRDLGMGTKHLENQICEEVNELIEYIETNIENSFTSPLIFVKPITNVISNLLFNIRNRRDDVEFNRFIENLRTIFHSNRENVIIELFSKVTPMKYLVKLFPEVGQFIQSVDEGRVFIERQCRSRMAVEGEYAKPNCIFDFFWRYRYQDYPNVTVEEKFNDISHSMYDVYLGGSDTTTNMLAFISLMLGKYPDIQDDLRKELQSLVDEHSHINMDMRKDCPKVLSFIDEVQRYCILEPRFPRRALTDCKIGEYEISTEDMFYGDIGSIFKDPDVFENPHVFNAYRFLDHTRTKYTASKFLIPFGIGKRACFGESLAVMQLFLFVSKLILKFDITLPKETDENLEDVITGSVGLLHSPMNHEIIFKKRL